MQSRIAQYLNEITSLTMLALLVLALVAGQAGAAAESPVSADDVTTVVAEFSLSIRQKGE